MSHTLSSRRSRHFNRTAVTCLVTATTVLSPAIVAVAPFGVFAPAVAQAEELPESEAELLQRLEELSRDAEGLSQQSQQLELDIADKQRALDELQADVDRSYAEAAAARDELLSLQDEISRFAVDRMRGNVLDPATSMLGADSAQGAIDRSSYVERIRRQREALLDQLNQARETTAEKYTEASAARGLATMQLADLNQAQHKLNEQQTELDRRISEVRSAVDALTAAQAEAWRNKNNPISAGIDAMVGVSGAVDAAMSKVGAPYEWGAAGPSSFDCSGLMYWAYQQMGKTIPRTSQAQLSGGTPVSRDQLRPGDIIGYYPGITHVGMYIGGGKIVHASDYGIPVQVVSIDQGGPYQGAVRY